LFVFDETFDLVGRGIVEATWDPVGPGVNFCSPICLNVRYTFSVPEPPTLLLVVVALAAFFGVRFLRERHRKLVS
jgi:hypothetical protein